MNLRASSAGLSLAFLNALKLPVENIRGEFALDMTITGSLIEPQPRGSFRLADGAFTVKNLGLEVNRIVLTGSGDARRLTVSQVTAHSANGSLDGSGVISLTAWTPENININIAAKRWPAIQTERYRAIADADLRIGGSLKAPTISGNARVSEGTVRPSLDFLNKGAVSRQRDPTIVVVRQRGGKPVETPSYLNAQNSSDNALWRALALNLAVAIPNNFWIRHPNANVEISGNLTVDKRSGGEPTLTGLVETVRGYVGFQGRRFDLTRGLVRFTGEQPINPTLDVAAEYRLNDYTVTAVAGGNASKPTLTLSSTPQLDQSDILAVLLFGKPTSSLNSNEQVALRQNAIDVSAGFAASQVGQAVSDALGLESLGDVDFSGGEVRFGRYLGQQTYFSLRQQIADKHGQEIAVEYRLTPSIRVDASTRTDGNSGLDVIWHKRY
jgi:translocation and assembly module TamB